MGENVSWNGYCLTDKILLVGEGDFSFAYSLAKGLGSGSNILATTLDSHENFSRLYHNKCMNDLISLGGNVLYDIDVTKMRWNRHLRNLKFDQIIFNFPHAGSKIDASGLIGTERRETSSKVIRLHKELLRGFFLNARCLLKAGGQIHVTNQDRPPYCWWNIEKLALQSRLKLVERANFEAARFPNYFPKRGFGRKCRKKFFFDKVITYKFKNM